MIKFGADPIALLWSVTEPLSQNKKKMDIYPQPRVHQAPTVKEYATNPKSIYRRRQQNEKEKCCPLHLQLAKNATSMGQLKMFKTYQLHS